MTTTLMLRFFRDIQKCAAGKSAKPLIVNNGLVPGADKQASLAAAYNGSELIPITTGQAALTDSKGWR